MLDKQNLDALSRTFLYALRHAPERYFLELDADGWANLEFLLLALRYERPEWASVEIDDLERAFDVGEGGRIECRDGYVRALYGHSVALSDTEITCAVPSLLYHGTTVKALPQIRVDGLRPMTRRFVHLTSDWRYACAVASAKGNQPTVLEIAAAEAELHGCSFRPAKGACPRGTCSTFSPS